MYTLVDVLRCLLHNSNGHQIYTFTGLRYRIKKLFDVDNIPALPFFVSVDVIFSISDLFI